MKRGRTRRSNAGPAAAPTTAATTPPGDGRTAAVQVLRATLLDGARLDDALEACVAHLSERRERALARELATGVVRWLIRLDALIDPLLSRPLADPALRIPLRLGIYQLEYTRIPPHAAVSSAVDAARVLGLGRATGLVNGVLRGFQRQREDIIAGLEARPGLAYGCPLWLAEAIAAAWPDDHEAILAAQTRRAPLTLRVNTARVSRDDLAARLAGQDMRGTPGLHSACALAVEGGGDPSGLPGFAEGEFVVQDEASQLVASVLGPAPGERVLDACAAPGGKAGALLQAEPTLKLTALDVDHARLARVQQTLERIGAQADCLTADARDPAAWWDGNAFDAILLDAPCTATGIIRRHPDIAHRRRAGDDERMAEEQMALLEGLWPCLRTGGRLVYATCSILPTENARVVDRFLALHDDARAEPIEANWGRPAGAGRQILPGEDGMDGFFYALLRRG